MKSILLLIAADDLLCQYPSRLGVALSGELFNRLLGLLRSGVQLSVGRWCSMNRRDDEK